MQTLICTVRKHFPLAADYNAQANLWVGMRPMTPDSRPGIRQCGADNVYVNCGHGMPGWTLAAGTADIPREQILYNESSVRDSVPRYRMTNR